MGFKCFIIYFFYRSIKDIDWTNEFLPRFTSAFENYPFIFTGVFLLVILNWNFEALKFKLLLQNSSLTQVKSFFTVLGGMAISNFTPARSGEYIGRSLLLKGIQPLKITIATVAGNLAQVLMTYGLGLISICVVYFFF